MTSSTDISTDNSTHQNSIPRMVEARKFVTHEVELAGIVPHSSLERLAGATMAVNDVKASLAFKRGVDGKPCVVGELEAELGLQCQRCLKQVTSRLDVQVNWAMVWDDLELKALPAHYEPWVVGAEAVDLYMIIEEELLLAVPVVAFHEKNCLDSRLLSSGEDSESEMTESEDKPNPFQDALKDLKDSL